MNYVVPVSGGKDSTSLALWLNDNEPRDDYQYVCTPTGNELPDWFAHMRTLSEILGKPIIPVVGGTLKGIIGRRLPQRSRHDAAVPAPRDRLV